MGQHLSGLPSTKGSYRRKSVSVTSNRKRCIITTSTSWAINGLRGGSYNSRTCSIFNDFHTPKRFTSNRGPCIGLQSFFRGVRSGYDKRYLKGRNYGYDAPSSGQGSRSRGQVRGTIYRHTSNGKYRTNRNVSLHISGQVRANKSRKQGYTRRVSRRMQMYVGRDELKDARRARS